MIKNFEIITAELTDLEKEILPTIIQSFEKHSKENPIKATEIVTRVKEYLKKEQKKIWFTEVRLRKMVNYIRANSILPIIATSKGYYVSYDKEEVGSQIQSLSERANSIITCVNGLMKFA